VDCRLALSTYLLLCDFNTAHYTTSPTQACPTPYFRAEDTMPTAPTYPPVAFIAGGHRHSPYASFHAPSQHGRTVPSSSSLSHSCTNLCSLLSSPRIHGCLPLSLFVTFLLPGAREKNAFWLAYAGGDGCSTTALNLDAYLRAGYVYRRSAFTTHFLTLHFCSRTRRENRRIPPENLLWRRLCAGLQRGARLPLVGRRSVEHGYCCLPSPRVPPTACRYHHSSPGLLLLPSDLSQNMVPSTW